MCKDTRGDNDQKNLQADLTEDNLRQLRLVAKSPFLRQALDLLEKQGDEPPKRRQRVQLDFAEKDLKRIGELAKLSGVDSKADFVRNALIFFEWYVCQVKQAGYQLALKNGEECIEIEIIF
jgi:hypothetical protein